jgi:YebC/PmpR family DNA-binding regulatory protein
MSGHSHWASIKHQKQAEDLKKSRTFSKIAQLISVAVRQQGTDPSGNSALQAALDKAKAANMPAKSVERAIQQASQREENLEAVTYEALGPSQTALIIQVITNNRNRTRDFLRKALNQHNGKLAEVGAVKWLFQERGIIYLPDTYHLSEDLELEFIEAGAEDIRQKEESITIYTKPQDLQVVVDSLRQKGYQIDFSTIGWLAKETLALENNEKKKLDSLLETLEEEESVQEIYTNTE